MIKLAHVGDFCPNEACPDYGKFQSHRQRNIKKAARHAEAIEKRS